MPINLLLALGTSPETGGFGSAPKRIKICVELFEVPKKISHRLFGVKPLAASHRELVPAKWKRFELVIRRRRMRLPAK
ncbi:MAG: hypothetical protein KIH09_17525 [Candidatus Freyarchaeota archaeon]|nr:hypothetical protein [Candidatus Jordarchaeia archaeon]